LIELIAHLVRIVVQQALDELDLDIWRHVAELVTERLAGDDLEAEVLSCHRHSSVAGCRAGRGSA